jgi:hypothetical protein
MTAVEWPFLTAWEILGVHRHFCGLRRHVESVFTISREAGRYVKYPGSVKRSHYAYEVLFPENTFVLNLTIKFLSRVERKRERERERERSMFDMKQSRSRQGTL